MPNTKLFREQSEKSLVSGCLQDYLKKNLIHAINAETRTSFNPD